MSEDNTERNLEDLNNDMDCGTSEGTDSKEQEIQEQYQLNSFIEELNARFKLKKDERFLNDRRNFEYPDESFFVRNLDSSIKKNTAFVKKLRNMTEAQKDVIMKDLASLNLSRYVSELASALVETKIKLTEVSMCVSICSFLHLRYQDFSALLLDAWIKNLPRKPTDTFNASKMRIDIRLFTELILTGIFSAKDALPVLGNLLTILTTTDKENHKNLNIISGFCRQFANEFAGLVPRKMRLKAEKFNQSIPICDFLSVDRQKGVRTLLKEYYQSLIIHVTRDFKRLQSLKNEMKRYLMTRGEVSKHQKETFENKNSEFQKLEQIAQQFADLIDEELPVMKSGLDDDDNQDLTKSDGSVVFDFNRLREQSANAGMQLWEDEETRTFYENLPDLKSLIPAILYKDSLKEDAQIKETADSSNDQVLTNGDTNDQGLLDDTNKVTINEETLKENEISIDEEEFADSGKDVSNLNENDELEIALSSIQKSKESKEKGELDNEEKPDNKSSQQAQKAGYSKSQIDIFFASLLNCVNRDYIDKAALTFATTFNTKTNRKKLVNVLFTVPRTRLDLLPFFARFVAQLNPIMPTLTGDLVSILRHNFRYLFKKKDQINLMSKVKNIRFIAELVKFGLFPKPDVLCIIKTLLTDFRYHHVEMTCNLFETCGQYLYRSPDSHHMTNHLLDQMMRHKTRLALDNRYAIMCENAFYNVNPPEDKLVRNIPTKPVMHLYIENLIYKELTKSATSKVLVKLRKINWQDPEISSYAIKCLASVYNLKYYNIVYVAHLLFGLYSYQEWVIPRVLDTILEDIRLGLQMNSIEYNQRRIAVIKFFAECFNYRLCDSGLLFRVLYQLITYGVNYSDITQSPLDPPLNLIRLRLAAQIMHSCGSFLTSGLSRKKLDYYLYFYQRYYWLKKSYLQSLSAENVDMNAQFYIDGIFKDIINYLKPKFRIADSYQTACKQLETHLKEVADKVKELMPNATLTVDQVLNPNQHQQERKNVVLDPIVEEDFPEDDLDENENVDDYDNESNLNEGCDEDDRYSDDGEMADEIDDEEIEGDGNKDVSDSDNEPQMKVPNIVKCAEDDEFQRDFERMLSESLTLRTTEVVRSNVEIVIPIERDNEKKKKTTFDTFDDDAYDGEPFSMSLKNHSKQEPNTFKFKVMTRNVKSNKPLLKTIEVASDSELVQNYLHQEEENRKAKEAVKRLILDINQRRELEDSSPSLPSRSLENSGPRIPSVQQQPQQSVYYRPADFSANSTNNTVNYHQYRRRFN